MHTPLRAPGALAVSAMQVLQPKALSALVSTARKRLSDIMPRSAWRSSRCWTAPLQVQRHRAHIALPASSLSKALPLNDYGPSQCYRKRDHGIAGRQFHYNNMLRSPFSSQAESLVPHQNHRRDKRPSKCVGKLRTGLPRTRHIKRVRHSTFPHIPTTMRVRDQPVKSLPPGAIGSREEDQLRQADSWKVNSVGESASVYPGYGLAAERK